MTRQEYMIQYRKNHRDIENARRKRYYDRHRDEILAKMKEQRRTRRNGSQVVAGCAEGMIDSTAPESITDVPERLHGD